MLRAMNNNLCITCIDLQYVRIRHFLTQYLLLYLVTLNVDLKIIYFIARDFRKIILCPFVRIYNEVHIYLLMKFTSIIKLFLSI